MLYKLERMQESLDIFRLIVDCSRDKDEPPDRADAGRPKVRPSQTYKLYIFQFSAVRDR